MTSFGGWDAPQVFNTSVYPGESNNDSRAAIEKSFYDFLRTFRIDHSFVYRCVFLLLFMSKRSIEIESFAKTLFS